MAGTPEPALDPDERGTLSPGALLDTDAFFAELLNRIATAQQRVLVQLMTFDGDAAGLPVADALIAAAGRGVVVDLVVDCFALRFVSDQSATAPAVANEVARTQRMFRALRDGGVTVQFTNPYGPTGWLYYMARNHKKIVVIDDTAYLGGVNVSDHNASWHDFMVRLTDPVLVEAVVADVLTTQEGRVVERTGPILTNGAIEATFDEMVTTAERRVVVASPYAVDRRLPGVLAASGAPERTLVLAPDQNYPYLELITPAIVKQLDELGVRTVTYRRFSHAKFLLADDRLLVGSSNFGRHSFWCNQEIGLIIDDPAFVAHFVATMLDDLVEREPEARWQQRAVGAVAAVAMDIGLRAYARVVVPRVPPLADFDTVVGGRP
ncbi:MAG: phosphatidylserine/phosphatidylglycerophosphate/cardiolipin synthase family protein [Actinomycetota bacterium]